MRRKASVERGFNTNRAGITARIDTRHDAVVVHDRCSYWLTGPDVPDAEFLFSYLLKHQDDWEVTVEEEPNPVVRLTVPWKPIHSREVPIGDRVLWLDPLKAYMPVRGKARWQDASGWRSEEFSVDEADAVNGLWIPTKITEIVGSSSFGPEMPDAVNVIETTVQNIRVGAVTALDLVVEFPEGTEVVDAIDGVGYTIGADGQRTDSNPLFVGNRFVNEPAAPESRGVSWLFLLCVFLVIASFGWHTLRRRS